MATFVPPSQPIAAPRESVKQQLALKLKQAADLVRGRSSRTSDTQVLGARDSKDAVKRKNFQPRFTGRAPPLSFKEAASFPDEAILLSHESGRVLRDGPQALEAPIPSYEHRGGRLFRPAPEDLIHSHGAPRQAPHPPVGNTQTGSSPCRPRRRPQQGKRSRPSRNQQAGEPEEENNNEDGDDNSPRSPPVRLKGSRPARLLFACPFFKYDRNSFFRCWGKYELTTFPRVKQHLERCHVLGDNSYCPTCWTFFRTLQERDDHCRSAQCTAPRVSGYRYGLYPEELNLLITDSRMSEEEKWYVLWDRLFAPCDPPESPYLLPGWDEAELFFRDNGEEPLMNELPGLLERNLGIRPYNLSLASLQNLHSDLLAIFFQRTSRSLLLETTSRPAGDVGLPAPPQQPGDSSSTVDHGDVQAAPLPAPHDSVWPAVTDPEEDPEHLNQILEGSSPPNPVGHYSLWQDYDSFPYIFGNDGSGNDGNGNAES
ncbi:hypothetical protein GQ53DRAFT_773337 [Thozetella sp. PMI_491]|nr:hypothetical protein GQ53DRAFT_773337 [Thozetella sp. PMI_491]